MCDRLTLLGTGTCQLEPGRAASSVLLELGELKVVYDFGRGVATRLAGRGLRQDEVRHVVLSHFHPDHLTDLLPYLQAASWSPDDPRHEDLHIWGPTGLETQLMRMLSLFEPDILVRPDRFRVHLHELRTDQLVIEGRRFDWVDLPPADNHGLRFSRGEWRCALTGDSHFHDQEIEFLRGVDLAIFDSGHLDDEQIVELAVQSGAGKLVASHLYRELDTDSLEALARGRGWQGKLMVGEDGLELPIPD